MNRYIHKILTFQHALLKIMLLCCFSVLYPVNNLLAQQLSWEYYLDKFIQEKYNEEQLISDYEESTSISDQLVDEAVQELYAIRDQPFNVNVVTKQDLERLFFLQANQIEDICHYLYRYGPLKSLGELRLVRSLDYDRYEFLKYFLYIDDKPVDNFSFSLKNLFKGGHYMLTTKLEVPLYQRDGYKNYSDSILLINPDKKYLGNALNHDIRMQYNYRSRIFWGFTAAKDPGEPFVNNLNKGYDSYSFHLFLKNLRCIDALALGDYRFRVGEGLLFGSAFSMGKDFNISLQKPVINKFTSTDEYAFFRGGAVSLRWNDLRVSSFFSLRKMDASLDEDGYITSLKTDGYHRTWTEYKRKRNVFNGLYGAHVSWIGAFYKFGATGYYQHWNHEFSTGDKLYKYYAPKGSKFWGTSIDYGVMWRKISFSGETAYSGLYGGWASINKLQWRPLQQLRLYTLYRFYSYRYYAQHAAAFSEGSKTQNESGCYLGFESYPWRFLRMQGFFDFYYFPWPKYGLNHSSKGYQIRFQIDLRQNRSSAYQITYGFKKKEKFNLYHHTHRIRLKYFYRPSDVWQFQTECSGVGAYKSGSSMHYGGLIGESCSWVINKLLKTSVTCAYIHADGSLCSLSLYEPGLLYSYSFHNYYHRLFRVSARMRFDFARYCMIQVKYGLSRYLDVNEVSSGRQRIGSPLKQDLYFQLRVKI